MKKNYFKPLLALALVVAMCVGGTLAYITSVTDKYDNSFVIATPGESTDYLAISLDETFTLNGESVLNETTGTATFLPGDEITKSPIVSLDKLDIVALTEGAYVFVQITDENAVMSDLGFAINETDWTALEGEDGVYYRKQDAQVDASIALPDVFSTDTITIRDDYTYASADARVLSVQAFAIQANNLDTPALAWNAIQSI